MPLAEAIDRLGQRATAAVVVHQLRKGQPVLQHQLERELALAFVDLGNRVERAAADTMLRHQAQLFESKWRTTLTVAQKEQLVSSIMNTANLHSWASAKLTPTFEKWWNMTSVFTGRVLVQQGIMEQVRPEIARKMTQAGGTRRGMVDIEGDTRKAIMRTIDQGIQDGLSPRDTAKLMRDIVPEGRFVNAGASYRSTMIARTEMRAAQNRSAIEHYRTMPTVQNVVAFDGDQDEECAARNGQIFTLDEAEVEDADTHPNCVLAFGPVAS